MLDQRIHELQSDIDNLNLKFDRMRTMTYSELNTVLQFKLNQITIKLFK